MNLRPVRALAAAVLLPAVLLLAGCGDVGGPGDTDPVRAGATSESSLEGWDEGGDRPPLDDSVLCDQPGHDETEEIDMSIPPGTPLSQVFADGGTTAALLRTDRSDDAAWTALTELVTAGADFDGSVDDCGDPFLYHPAILTSDDPAWEGLTADAAPADLADVRCYLLLADGRSVQEVAAGGEVTVLWVDLRTTADEAAEVGLSRSFRSTVDVVAEVEANLAIANMDFFEYADGVDPDGVYRGF